MYEHNKILEKTLYKGTVFFVSSSTNTWDVFKMVSPSFFLTVRDCSLPIFIGTNEFELVADATVITCPRRSGWRNELANQIAQLPPAVERVILVLDDFYFFNRFSENALREAIDQHESQKMDYLRCEPPRRSWIGQALLLHKNRHYLNIRLTEAEPYYSSLQIAIWSRKHLTAMLTMQGNIWEFEWQIIHASNHYAVKHPLFNYQHLVEKGKWLPQSTLLLGKTANLAKMETRGFHSFSYLNSKFVTTLRFGIFGYSLMRIKAYISIFSLKFKQRH